MINNSPLIPATGDKSAVAIPPSVVDTREQNETLWRTLRGHGWQRQGLHCGDFCIWQSADSFVLVERKTVVDLIASMHSGRMMNQAMRLRDASPWPVLLIEGHWVRDKAGYVLGSRYKWGAIWNFLQTVQDAGLRIQLTTSVEHTVERLVELEGYYQKSTHPSMERGLSENPQVAVLCHIRGVSDARAKVILEHIPTLGDIVQAEQTTLATIPGIGPEMARRIYQFWRQTQ